MRHPPVTPVDSPARHGEIRAVTGLRGIASVFVASYHFTAWGLQAPAVVAPLIRHGYLGVDLFFVLSGFVMALTYDGSFAAGVFRYREFLSRRLRRIYPLYAIAVLATYIVVRAGVLPPLSQAADSPARLGIDLLLLQCLGAGPSLLPVAWSLSTEWIAYLAFPVLSAIARRRGIFAARAMGVVCVLVLLGLCAVPYGRLEAAASRTLLHQPLGFVDTRTVFPLLRCLAGFCLGLLAWRATCSPRWAAASARPWARRAVLLFCFGVLWTPWADAVVVPGFALLLVCVGGDARPGRGGVAWWLGAPPFHWLGLVSYSLYLTHLMLWQAVHGWMERRGVPPLWLLAPALGVAWACYRGIELPFRAALKKPRLGGAQGLRP
jgi:peptidoglycan/LPS O-acetylase OafA/YrhL